MVVVNSEDITLESIQGSLDTYLGILKEKNCVGGTAVPLEEDVFEGSAEVNLWEVEDEEVDPWEIEDGEVDQWEIEDEEEVSYEEVSYEEVSYEEVDEGTDEEFLWEVEDGDEVDQWEVEETEEISYEGGIYEEDTHEEDLGGINHEESALWEIEDGNEEDHWEVEESYPNGGTDKLKTDVQADNCLEFEKVSTVSANSSNIVEKVPTDLREFVRKNPNCEMSLALKYFSKKEIDRQLSLGRVFKRKNRLLV